MPRTARRRWTKELVSEVDGIALAPDGPVLVHGYDPPAGGKWIDDAIPGKLGALDRTSGEVLWLSPCEVGYGRGFGAGFAGDDCIVLGPSTSGHRAVRMSAKSGELLDARDIEAFDEALVFEDHCFVVTRGRVWAISTGSFVPTWSYSRKGERYHMIARDGDHLFVVYTKETDKKQGVLVLDAATGKLARDLLDPVQKVVHAIAADSGCVTCIVSDLLSALPPESLTEYLLADPDADPSAAGVSILCVAGSGKVGDKPLWYEVLDTGGEEYPDVSIYQDSGKLYLAQGASLEVRDLVTGKSLGEMTVPGLDEHVSWKIAHGAGAVAEETRLSVFEIPD